jgi:uncharacterized protein with FMN-binding domain
MRRILLASLATVSSVGLLFAYPTSHNASASSGSPSGSAAGSAVAAGAASTVAGSAATGSAASVGTGSAAKTYNGAAVNTQWGVVQVQITVQGGTVVAAKALQYPNDNGHSQGINDYALPILNAEAVKAGNSASIDAVGGATVTTGGYVSSLQSALDAAHI